MRKIIKTIYILISVMITSIGLIMLFGFKGASEFMDDVSLRMKVQFKILKENLEKDKTK